MPEIPIHLYRDVAWDPLIPLHCTAGLFCLRGHVFCLRGDVVCKGIGSTSQKQGMSCAGGAPSWGNASASAAPPLPAVNGPMTSKAPVTTTGDSPTNGRCLVSNVRDVHLKGMLLDMGERWSSYPFACDALAAQVIWTYPAVPCILSTYIGESIMMHGPQLTTPALGVSMPGVCSNVQPQQNPCARCRAGA